MLCLRAEEPQHTPAVIEIVVLLFPLVHKDTTPEGMLFDKTLAMSFSEERETTKRRKLSDQEKEGR